MYVWLYYDMCVIVVCCVFGVLGLCMGMYECVCVFNRRILLFDSVCHVEVECVCMYWAICIDVDV